MPKSSKPIVFVCGSPALDYVDIDKFITPFHCGEIITQEQSIIDISVKQWAFRNKIEYVCFKPNYEIWKDNAEQECIKDAIQFCDIVIIFWDNILDIEFIYNYAKKMNRRIYCHLVETLD